MQYRLYSYNGTGNYRIVRLKTFSGYTGRTLSQIIKEFSSPQMVDNFESESSRCSLSRTKRRIKEICLCNEFEYFVTLTINSKNADRFNLDEVQSTLKNKFRTYKRYYNKEFKYIFITEKHKDGAFHFHGMMKNIDENDIYINDFGYYSSHYFDKLGFNSFSKIIDYNKCCSYIMKYITKDCVRNSNGYIYIYSQGLKKCDIFSFSLSNDKIIDKFVTFSNDYLDCFDFNVSDEKYKDLLVELTHCDNFDILPKTKF